MEQQRTLLRLIATATEEHLPLSSLLAAWARDERGVQQRRVYRLARLLKDGTPLADAVEQVPGALSDEDVLAIRVGVQSGTLAATLRDSLGETETAPSAREPLFTGTIIYVCAVTFVVLIIVAFMCIKIVPVIEAILDDFDLQQPRALRWSIQFALLFESFWWIGLIAVVLIAWSTLSSRLGRFIRNSIGGKVLGPLRELRAAELLQKLGVASQAGRPIAGALSTLARYHYDPTIRHKLLFVRNEVEQGADAWQSMCDAGLLTPAELNVLKTADRVGNRPWALRKLAAGKKRRTWRRLERLSELFMPAMVLVLGAFVLFQALALFMPLTQLLASLL